MTKRLVSPRPGASRTLPAITEEPSSPKAIMCSLRMLAPALVPPTVTPCALRLRISLRDRRAAEQGREPQLVAAGEEDAAWPPRAAAGGRAPGSRAACRNPSR